MHINKKSISESIEDSMKNNKPNVKRMRASNPQSVVNPVMSDALKSSEEFDKNSEKVFTDLSKKSKDITPKEPTTGKKVNRKPYTEGFKLDESLFDDSSIKENWCDDKLDELISKPKSEWTQDDYEAYFYCKNALAERDYYDSYDESLNGVTNMNHNLEEDWSKGLSFTFKITTNSLQNAYKNGSILVGGKNGTDLSSMYDRTSLRFRIVDKPYSAANRGYIKVDRNESELHVNLYDKDFTYKDVGGKSNFNKAKLTQEMEKLKNSIENDLKDADLVVTQSKVEVGGSSKFDTTWRQAQKYNEDLDLSNDKDFDTYSNFNSDLYNAMCDVIYEYDGLSKKDIEKAVEWFLTHFFDDYEEDELEESKHIQKTRKKSSKLREASYDRLNDSDQFDEDKDYYNEQVESGHFWDSSTTSKATMGRIADILLKVKEYFTHHYNDEGLHYFNDYFLPKAVDSGVKFGIDPDKLKFVKKWFDSGNPDGEMSKKIWDESYTRKKSSKSSLSESRWDDYNDVEEFDKETVYDFIDERLFGVSYTGRINGGNYRATNKFCSDVWMNLTRPGGSTKKTFFYPDHFDGAIDDESRESSTESRRAPTSDGIAVYLRDESEGNLAKAVADELELDYKVKQIGSYNKTNYKYIATIVIPDYIAEMPIDEYLLTIGKSITNYKKSRKTSKAAERELVAV